MDKLYSYVEREENKNLTVLEYIPRNFFIICLDICRFLRFSTYVNEFSSNIS
jgi:hypothetical protein